jgi:secondary thiamine-phosphate synthase enzyme
MTMATAQEKKTSRTVVGELSIKTERRTQLLDVTLAVGQMVRDSGVHAGTCHLYVPHTTAGIIINEAADPDVAHDIERALDRLVPKDGGYRHAEGNSDSHIKSTLAGSSATVFVVGGRLDLGRWQGIFFCEFDGPRERTLRIKVVPD